MEKEKGERVIEEGMEEDKKDRNSSRGKGLAGKYMNTEKRGNEQRERIATKGTASKGHRLLLWLFKRQRRKERERSSNRGKGWQGERIY